ncbi:energy transducer TonB [Cytophaga aurantiaca]|uniref:energy transducer TonB n=1 Tax=Cytophaga aurantiaca TaxID=29530 RepID=UPI0003726F18|nr:energy transducer TonB [Cytophaga aurantiaca]
MSKYDIKKSPQLPSDEEINKHKNFDKVLNKAAMYDYKKATKPVYKNVKVLSIVAVIVAVGLIFLFEIHEENIEHEKKTQEVDTIQKNNTVPLQDTTDAPLTKPISSTPQSSTVTSVVPVTPQTQTPDNSATVHTATGTAAVKTLADFPGGDDALNKFLLSNIKYPYNAVETAYTGKVEVELKIEPTGEIGNITIYHSPNAAISNEIQRVIKKMPKWSPAVKNDQAVASMVTVYFPFTYVGD